MNIEMQHYVYLLSSKVEEKYYIGVRSCKCKIGEDVYMGSSKFMTKEEKSNCNKIILDRFNTREEAITYEIELHEKFDVANNPLFWNKAKQTSKGFDVTGIKVSQEIKNKIQKTRSKKLKENPHVYDMAKEQKQILSLTHSGKTLSEEHKNALKNGAKQYHKNKNGDYSNLTGKCGKGNKGIPLSEDHKRKISEGNKGKKMSESFRKKTSERMTGKGNPMYRRKNPHSEEYRQSITGEGNPFYGCKHSDETKKKISDARKNKTPEQKLARYEKFYKSRTGKELTEEQKQLKLEEYSI